MSKVQINKNTRQPELRERIERGLHNTNILVTGKGYEELVESLMQSLMAE